MLATKTVIPVVHLFSHHDAETVARRIIVEGAQRRIVIDLCEVFEATTGAFARLILLRRQLRRSGGDLCLRGLHDRVRGLYEISRLHRVLPLTP